MSCKYKCRYFSEKNENVSGVLMRPLSFLRYGAGSSRSTDQHLFQPAVRGRRAGWRGGRRSMLREWPSQGVDSSSGVFFKDKDCPTLEEECRNRERLKDEKSARGAEGDPLCRPDPPGFGDFFRSVTFSVLGESTAEKQARRVRLRYFKGRPRSPMRLRLSPAKAGVSAAICLKTSSMV